MEEVYTFAVFFAVAAVFEQLETYIEHMPEYRVVARFIKHGCMCAPTLHACRHMVEHVLVYSHMVTSFH